MNTNEKYNEIFCEVLEVNPEQLAGLKYHGTELWDSVGHMNLIATIEDAFEIMLETDDIVDFSSYIKGLEILEKYEIEF